MQFFYSKLDEDNLYMAYADIMAKVLSATFTLLLSSRALMAGMMILNNYCNSYQATFFWITRVAMMKRMTTEKKSRALK